MATPNDLLRAARQRTASLAYPDDCLTRQELAELVNAWVWDHHQQVVDASANYLGKLERGIIRWPGKLYREAFRAILGVSTDAALGFVNGRRAAVKLEDVDRRQFLQTTPGMGAMALGGRSRRCWRAGSPPRFLVGSGRPTSSRSAPPRACSPVGTSPTAEGWPGTP